jgi:hypothetical protein
MLPFMREEMPNVPERTLKKIYGSIKTLRTEYDWDSPIRQGAVRAYTRVNGILFAIAIVLNIVPVVLSFCMPGKFSSLNQAFWALVLTLIYRLLLGQTAECGHKYRCRWPTCRSD